MTPRRVAGTPLLCLASLVVALASLALPSAPGYDAWSWLVWAREVVDLDLSTSEGPAWKPLPVMVAAPVAAVSEELAPEVWLTVARAGAVLAGLLALSLARRLAGGSWAAGLAAAVGLLLVPGWIENAAVGNSEGLLTALVLIAAAAVLDGRPRIAFAVGVAAALLRVEVWPFVAALGAHLAWRDRGARGPVVLAGIGVPALWLVPELVGSGELLRSADRARVPNPGAPALAPRPALATLAGWARLAPPIALGGVLALCVVAASRARAQKAAREALLVAGAGVAWAVLVAAMSELGFSGESRYLLPGTALVTVAGLAAPFLLAPSVATQGPYGPLARRAARPAMAGLVGLGLAVTGGHRWDSLRESTGRVAYGAALAADLEQGVERAGGAAPLLRCGPPHVGPYRGPMLAWALGVHKAEVGFGPSRPGVAFRSRLGPASPLAPAPPPGAADRRVRTGRWEIVGACR